MPAIRPFRNRLLPAPRDGGFRMDGYWIWCGSVVQGEDGRYHMFASRVDKRVRFSPHWLFMSEVVRASSDTPEGPYSFEEVVLPCRDPRFFDARSTHNPQVRKHGDTYLLYYLGVSYPEDPPTPECPVERDNPEHDAWYQRTWNRKRVGLAISDSVCGPWERMDAPILEPRPGNWDSFATTNPSPWIHDDGSVLLFYKSRTVDRGPLQIGMARAPAIRGPYAAVADHPAFSFDDPEQHVEDPYLWHEDGVYQVIMKDMTGGVCGAHHGGIHAWSANGEDWTVADDPLAYSRDVVWDDGATETMGSFERPFLLIQDGRPTHLFAATADGPGGFWNADNTWNMCIPLAAD
ncbi:MAG: glycoside hydrolase family protein [Planctomycetota bacterium]|jgi:hypothetical protein|nr:glycoside hydrolase family protein [Planctomycetota bacterium]